MQRDLSNHLKSHRAAALLPSEAEEPEKIIAVTQPSCPAPQDAGFPGVLPPAGLGAASSTSAPLCSSSHSSWPCQA
ncbi:hypothetical protein CIB84_002218 [Bambusicola thoracicus]|uniref:Uncharacterized protein n=1 Tax=Bambusicola thoracicus TaxID=9083 RepID=A0A2P4TCE0_BAMTH|nr:hypothetical protein CIB84_002218 [Bambusicola thoracicus]